MASRYLNQFIFQTPAKINTFLFIQKKRADGYHDLLMDLIPVSFYDTIHLEKTASGILEFSSNMQGIPAEENLVVKAVRLLEKTVDKQFSLKINLDKKIPSGAGLGGGSGNAAGVLKVLNRWYEIGLPDKVLGDLALKLGADVPFFLNPRPSHAQGVGEDLCVIPGFKPLEIILLNPGFQISTGKAYSNCHISGRKEIIKSYTPGFFSTQQADINDFWLSLVKNYPELTRCRQRLIDEGAVFSGLSGSGSTVFGIFETHETCDKAFEAIKSHGVWKAVRCNTLQHHDYFMMG